MTEQETNLNEFVETDSLKNEDKGVELARKTVCGIPPADWSVVRLGEVVRVVSGNSLPTEYQDGIDGEYPVYKVSDMNESGNQKYVSTVDNRLSKEDIEELNHTLYPKKTTILPKVGAALLTNKRRMLTEPASFDNNVMGWVPDEINPEFLYYVSCMVDMEAVAQKGAVPSISKAIAQSLKIPAPPSEEQGKIASVLYNVDQVIQKTESTVEQYGRIINGLQRTLIRDGLDSEEPSQNTPTGKYPSPWQMVRAGDHLNLRNGEFLSRDNRDEDGEFPVYGGNGIMGYTDKETVGEDTLVIGRVGAYCGNIHITHSDAWVTDNAIVVTELSEEYLPLFIAHLFDEIGLGQFAEHSAQPRISQSTVENIRIPKPPIEQQSDIVEKLASLKRAKEIEEEYRIRLERLKQGLMQDLLSGKVRTTDTKIEVLPEVAAHG